MNILVAGGAGYIGSVVTAELVRAGHRVVVYDNLSKGYRAALDPAAVFIHGDLADRAALDRVFQTYPIEAAMHFAAFIEAGESMQVPERYFRNNVANALTLLESMIAHNVRRTLPGGVRKFVFSSSAGVYGDPGHAPIVETDPLNPANAYGESKLLVERMLAWFGRIHGLRYASLRYFNAAGAAGRLGESHRPETHLIPLTLQVALGQRPHISIYGTDYPTPDGSCIRDYIHVTDLAQAHVLALEALAERDQLIYNLGNGQGFSVREVVEVCRRVTGHPIPAVEAPRRPGDPPQLVASSERIRRELGWQPRIPDLEAIVASAWAWHQAHPHGYEG